MSAQAAATGVWFDQDGQPHCPECNQSLRHEKRSQDETNNGHHNSVYRCTSCGISVLSG